MSSLGEHKGIMEQNAKGVEMFQMIDEGLFFESS